jgi:hypothetical protein
MASALLLIVLFLAASCWVSCQPPLINMTSSHLLIVLYLAASCWVSYQPPLIKMVSAHLLIVLYLTVSYCSCHCSCTLSDRKLLGKLSRALVLWLAASCLSCHLLLSYFLPQDAAAVTWFDLS